MKNFNKEQMILIVLIIIVIIVILLVSIILIYRLRKNNESEQNNISERINNENSNVNNYSPYEEGVFLSQEEIEEETKNDVYIENMSEVTNVYNSTIPIAKISVTIEDVIMNIFNATIESNNVEEFYNNNKIKIEENTNAKSYQEFVQLIYKIHKADNIKISRAKIKENSVKKNSNIIIAEIELELQNNVTSIVTIEINESSAKIKIS